MQITETKADLIAKLQGRFPKNGFGEYFNDWCDYAESEEWDSLDEMEIDAYNYIRDRFEEPWDKIDSLWENLNILEQAFCEEYLSSHNKVSAYQKAHPECRTENPDSLRSLASRFIRRKSVAAYLKCALDRYRKDAFECGLWSRLHSLQVRRDMLDAMQRELDERRQNVAKALALIEKDETTPGTEKAQRIADIVNHPIYGKATIDAFESLCHSLDCKVYWN